MQKRYKMAGGADLSLCSQAISRLSSTSVPRILVPVKTFLLLSSFAAIGLAQAPVIGNCTVLPANNIWNTRIDQLPVHPSSSTWVNTIGPAAPLHPDFGSGLWNGGPMGIPYITVPG